MAKTSKSNAGASRSAPAKRESAKVAPARAKPAARTTAQPRTTTRPRTGTLKTKTRARREAAPSLTPIRKHQNRSQLIAAVAADSGIEPRTVELVARSLSATLTRHLVRGGSGRVEIPFLGAALWRGRQAAQKPRTMRSPMLGRDIQIPARRAQPVPRFKPYRAFRERVARV